MKDIRNFNNRYTYHGYQEWYFDDEKTIYRRGSWKKNKRIGYYENHILKCANFYII